MRYLSLLLFLTCAISCSSSTPGNSNGNGSDVADASTEDAAADVSEDVATTDTSDNTAADTTVDVTADAAADIFEDTRPEIEQGDEALSPRVTEYTLEQEVDGEIVTRSYLIQAPAVLEEGKRYPVIFAFHGRGGQGGGFIGQLRPFIEPGRFVAILPDGIDNAWDLEVDETGPDDLAFVDAILTDIYRYRNLDFERVYAMGFSNGAGLVHLLALTRYHFAAHATMATALIAGEEPNDGVHKASFLSVHGMDDDVCPYRGGPGRVARDFLPVEESTTAWANQLGCPATPTETTTASGNLHWDWQPCDGGHRVTHIGVVNAGHNLPMDVEGGLLELIISFFEATP